MTIRNGARHAPIPFIDDLGRRCLRVPLDKYGRNYAVVTEGGYRRALAAGVSPAWVLNSNGKGMTYVRSRSAKSSKASNTLQVARIIADAPPGHVVSHVNGDRLDLRPDNLSVRRGRSKRYDRELVERLTSEEEADFA